MENLSPQYLTALHDRICEICTERTAEGTCGLPQDAVCPLEAYVVKIVDTVHSVSSNKMEDYVDALRKNVCAQCPNQSPGGTCPFRQNINCVLNRYFSLVVDAIEEVDERAHWPQCC